MNRRSLKIIDIASRGGKVPPLYLYITYIIPGAIYYRIISNNFKLIPFILISISIIPLMAATNLFDDYFDYKYGYDSEKSPNTRYRKHPIFFYGVTKNYLLFWGLFATIVYFLLFTLIGFLYGYLEIIISILGFILGYGYTGPPFKFKYRALGELNVAISAFLISIMIFYAEAGYANFNLIIFTIPYALILIPVLFLGNYRDIEYDREEGIKTLPIILGKSKSKRVPMIIFGTFYLLIILFSFIGIYRKISLLSLITVPFSIYGIRKWEMLPDTKYENFMGNLIFMNSIVLSVLLVA